ncbi:hypothetical protein ONZ45_g3360 [Pleurotus djamor]|nr:hypothetical protein ONZ45_g3360 [Pleurotus djamor]
MAISNAAENLQLKVIADAPRVEESTGSKMYNPASDPEAEVVGEAGLMDAFETAYRAIKAFLRKLKPQVKIPGNLRKLRLRVTLTKKRVPSASLLGVGLYIDDDEQDAMNRFGGFELLIRIATFHGQVKPPPGLAGLPTDKTVMDQGKVRESLQLNLHSFSQDTRRMISISTLTLASSVVLFVFWLLRHTRTHRLPLPPGPTSLPIIGSLFVAPTKYQWVTYARWSQDFGSDVLHFKVLGNSVIVLNSLASVQEILNRRSALSSSRPVSVIVSELMGWGFSLAFMPYGNLWRDRRRLFWREFNPTHVVAHRPTQHKYVKQFLLNLLDDPGRFEHHCHLTPGSAVIEIAYGFSSPSIKEEMIALADEAFRASVKAGITGTFLVDYLPILRYVPSWVPGAGFQSYAKFASVKVREMVHIPFTRVKGQASPCIIARAQLREADCFDDPEKVSIVKDVASVAYAAGADTTPSALINFIAAMVLFPDVQEKAHAEIDRVLGSRVPSLEDQPSLLYIQAMMWETLRWRPVVPLGAAHLLVADDTYDGYFLPKCSRIFPNVWAIFKDEAIFPQADEFIPERFITPDGRLDQKLIEILYMIRVAYTHNDFRRICPGRFFAIETLWLWMSSMLTAFKITAAKDELGRDVLPDTEIEPHLITSDLFGKSNHLPVKYNLARRRQRSLYGT